MPKYSSLEPAKVAKSKDPPDVLGVIYRQIAVLEATSAAIAQSIEAGEANPALAREAGSVARAIVATAAELRAREKAVQHTAASLPPELVMAHLRGLGPERRAHIVRELMAMDDQGSVLG